MLNFDDLIPGNEKKPAGAGSFGMFADLVPQQESGDFVRGAKVSLGQTVPILKGVVGLAGASAESAFGEGGIATGIKNWGLNGYTAGMEKLQPLQKETDELTHSWEQAKEGNLGALVDWVQYGLGYAVGQGGEALATSLIGGAIGAAAGGGVATPVTGPAGAITGLIAKGAVKESAQGLIQKAVMKEANALMLARAGEMTAQEAVKQATKTVAKNIGSSGALLAYGTGQELGSIYPEAEAEAAKKGEKLTGMDLARVWGSGLAAGGIEALTDKLGIDVAMGKLKMPGSQSRLGQGALLGGAGALTEAATEGVQTGIERVGAGQEVFSPEGVKDIINSAGLGAVGGGGIGGVAGLLHGGKRGAPADVERSNQAMDDLADADSPDAAIDAFNRTHIPITVPQGFDADAAMARMERANANDENMLRDRTGNGSPEVSDAMAASTAPAGTLFAGQYYGPGETTHPVTGERIPAPVAADATPEQPAAEGLQVLTGRIPGDYSGQGWGSSIGSLGDGTRRQLMVDPSGGFFWGEYKNAKTREGEDVLSGEHSTFTPAKFDTGAAAKAAAAATPQTKTQPSPPNGGSGAAPASPDLAGYFPTAPERIQAGVPETFGDRLAVVREKLGDSRTRQMVRDLIGPEALGDALYFAGQADNDKNTGAVSDQMLKRAETLLADAGVPQLPRVIQSEDKARSLAQKRLEAQAKIDEQNKTKETVAPAARTQEIAAAAAAPGRGLKERADAMRTPQKAALLTGNAVVNEQGYLEPLPKVDASTTPVQAPSVIDTRAAEAAASETNDRPDVTPAQAEAGNYKKGHDRTTFPGLDLSIENDEGSTRRDSKNDPPKWESKMTGAHYGYIKGTKSIDGEHMDVFVKPGTPEGNTGPVFIVDQIDPATGKPDEHKVMLGFDTMEDAKAAYAANYPKGWKGLKSISATPFEGFKQWLATGDTSKPFLNDDTVVSAAGGIGTLRERADAMKARNKPEPVATVTTPAAETEGKPPATVAPEETLSEPADEDQVGDLGPLVKHTTGKGKDIFGYVRQMTDAEARAIDPYTFKKDGGMFIREKHQDALEDFERARAPLSSSVGEAAPAPAPVAAPAPDSDVKEQPAAAAARPFAEMLHEEGFEASSSRAWLKKVGNDSNISVERGEDPTQYRVTRRTGGKGGYSGNADSVNVLRVLVREYEKALLAKEAEAVPANAPQVATPEGDRGPSLKERAEAMKERAAEAKPSLTLHFGEQIRAGNMPKDNPALRKMVEAFDGAPPTQQRMKEAQEVLEAAIVKESRRLAHDGGTMRAKFDKLLALYESQPLLNVRTSTSIENQAYSTPAPLALLASDLTSINDKTTVLEPTAGTGMLLIEAAPKNATVNELNDFRAALLKEQGFKVTQQDATTAVAPPKSVNRVITNPPFGPLDEKIKVDGYTIGQIDHLIAVRALESMKDDGSATLILGANKIAGGRSNDDLVFFNWLYGNYNVTSHFEVDGKLYLRQGAGWPVRVITIEGREKSAKISPAAGVVQRAMDWEQVYGLYEQGLATGRAQRGLATAPVSSSAPRADDAGPVSQPAGEQAPATDRREPEAGARGNADVAGVRPGPVVDPAAVPAERVGGADRAQRPGDATVQPDRLAGKPERPGTGKPGGDARATGLTDADNAFQATYTSRSSRKDAGVLIPVNMQQPTQDGLSALEDAVGDIDEYARKQLGYATVADLHDALMGLQVDSVASAIYQIGREKGTIIADQTGIGKGRQAASIIRWAVKNGRVPIFLSAKPSLFTDMFNDLHDIGTDDVAPLIMNSGEWISGEGNEKLFANKPGQHKKLLEQIASTGMLPEGRNALFSTYSQINVQNTQRQAMEALAPRAIFVLDESHNAGGDSATGDFMKGMLDLGKGVVYLSATYAKRPDNMPLYFKTDMGQAVADDETLLAAMEAGGLPLQTVVSNNLVKAGQMFRRERSYDGVEILTVNDTANRAAHEALSDEVTQALRAIMGADRMFHEVFFKAMKKEMDKEGGRALDNAGNQFKQSVDHTEFSSVVHNFVRQMLLGLEADNAANEAIAALQRGQKPLIALENTMGSFLQAYAEDNGIKDGAPLGQFDYRDVLSRALTRSRVLTKVLPNGDKVKVSIPLSQLDPVTLQAYTRAQEVIDGLNISIPVSPIDWMRDKIVKAGFTVAEITGRTLTVDYTNPKKPTLGHVDVQEKKDKVRTTKAFNSGKLDALILNVAGSTGISLHASEKFTDRRQRLMIVVQAAQDINIFMQMLGRTHRTGQVTLPAYKLLNADLPAVKRPVALLSKKMKSLNANTSSNTESATSVKSLDMLNKYGDSVVESYLADNPMLAMEMGLGLSDGVDDEGAGREDIARKATGRIALMPIAKQREFYEDIEAQYETLIDYLNKTNQNDLEPRTFDYDARELKSQTIFEGQNQASPFGQDAVYNEYSIKAQGKPMTPAEIREQMAEHLGEHKTGEAHVDALVKRLNAGMDGFLAKLGDADKEKAQTTQRMTRMFLRDHPIGQMLRVNINDEPYMAIVTNLRSTHKETGNPFSMSKVQVTLALNGALRSVTVPASRFAAIETSVVPKASADLDRMFREGPADERQVAKIVTGNLLAAYGELKGVRGTIISFTKEDGTTEQGIQLPKAFQPAMNLQNDYRLPNGEAAVLFLQRSINKDIGRFGIATRDGLVRVLPNNGEISISVPKSKAKGGKYFLDEKLRAVMGDFISKGDKMVATVAYRDAPAALDALMKKNALYALPSMASEARDIIGPTQQLGTEQAQWLTNPDRGGAPQAAVEPNSSAMKTGDKAADWLARNGAQPWVREVAAKLAPYIDSDATITFLKVGDKVAIPKSVADVFRKGGIFGLSEVDPVTGKSSLYLRYDADKNPPGQEDLLHELVHSGTQRALANTRSATIRAELESIRAVLGRTFDTVLTNPKANDQARNDAEFFRRVIDSPDELLAYGMTSRTFRKWAQSLDATGRFIKTPKAPDLGAEPKLTLWQKFVDVVRQLLGLSKMFQPRLDALLDRREAARIAFRTAETPETLQRRLDLLLQQVLDLRVGAQEYSDNWSPGRKGSTTATTEPFYSELARQVQIASINSAPAAGWSQFLRGLVNKGAVKQDELTWTGIEEWLAIQTGKVTREQVKAYLDGNGVKVTETKLGVMDDVDNFDDPDIEIEVTDEENLGDEGMRYTLDVQGVKYEIVHDDSDGTYSHHLVGPNGFQIDSYVSFAQAREAAGNDFKQNFDENTFGAAGVDGPTKYGSYQLPGGENYREVLLTLPTKEPEQLHVVPHPNDPASFALARNNGDYVRSGPESVTPGSIKSWHSREFAERYGKDAHDPVRKAQYKSGHWDQPNVLAHIRLNDRTSPITAAETARLKELGDRHRADIIKGITDEENAELSELLRLRDNGRRVLFVEEIQSDWGQAGKKQGFQGDTIAQTREWQQVDDTGERYDTQQEADDAARLTQVPFSTEIETRFVSRMFVDGWGVVEQSRSRNDSAPSKAGVPRAPFVGKTDAWVALSIKRVIKMAVDEGYDRVAFVNGEQSAERYDLSKQVGRVTWTPDMNGGTLVATDLADRNFLITETNVTPERLVDFVGKDVAQKLVDAPLVDGSKTLKGSGLKVGGDGMKAFYDKIVPSVAKEVVKKLGGAMTSASLQTGDMFEAMKTAREQSGLTLNEWNNLPRAQQEEFMPATSSKQLAFDITPAMRERAAGPLPQFGRDRIKAGTSEIVRTLRNIDQTQARNLFLDATTGHGSTNFWQRSVGTQYAKAEANPTTFKPVFNAVQNYMKDTSVFANAAADRAPNILPKLESLADLRRKDTPRADIDVAGRAAFEGTLKWTRDEQGELRSVDDAQAHADSLTTDQKARELFRAGLVTEAELKRWQATPLDIYDGAVRNRYQQKLLSAGVVFSDGELRKLFNATPDQIKLYREFRDATDQSLDDLGRTELVRLAGTTGAAVAKDAIAADSMQETAAILSDHIDRLTDATDSPAERDRLTETRNLINDKANQVARLKAQGYAPLMRFGEHTVHVTKGGETLYFGLYETGMSANKDARMLRDEYPGAEVVQGKMSQEAFKLYQGLDLNALELFAEATGNADNEVYQDFLRLTKNNRSAMKRMIERKGVAGFNVNTARVLASFVTSNARMASGNLHMGEALRAANAIPKELGDLKDEATKLVKYVQSPGEEAAAVRGLLFTNFIGGSVASALVNLTQPFTMSLPYLSQFGGATNAAKHLMAATRAAGGGKVSPEMAKVLKANEDLVSPQEVHHLQSEAMDRLGNHPFAKKAMFLWGSMFSLSEQFNRRVTFIAAHQAAMEQGMADPVEFARKAVIETQGLYNKGNKANWARGPIGATVMTFKQFSVHYLEFLTRMAKSGPEGKKAVALALGILMLVGGAGGLPFAEDLDDLIDTLAQALGYDFSSKKAKREFIADTLGMGDAAGEFFSRGISGVSGMPIDVSLRMGMGNLLPGTGALLRSNTDRSRDVLEFAGAAGSLAKSALDAGTMVLQGDVARGALNIAPVAIQNMVKAADMFNTGEYRNLKGQKVVDTDMVDAAAKFIGFNPATVATESQKQREIQRSIQLAKNVEGEIAAKWAQGLNENRRELVSEALADLASWNDQNPESQMRITKQQIIQRVRDMRASRAERTIKAAPTEMRDRVRETLQ